MSTIVITAEAIAPSAVALLQGHELVYTGKTPTPEDIVALCKQHNPAAMIVRYGKVGAAAMDAAPALRVISKHGSGTDNIDKAAAKERGIEVVAAVGANANAVAEHAFALLLACAKSIPAVDARMHAGHWEKASHSSLELSGRTVGIVGLGAIGRRFARMAEGFGMKVVAFDPFAKDVPDHVQLVDLEELFARSDVISLHCPLTEDNQGLLNANTLARCKPGVIIVNTARGALIDEAALLDSVRCGHVRAAGLDSFAVEPMALGHPFQSQRGFVLSPHVGSVTSDAYINMGESAARNALAVLARQAEAA
ncbi:hydroxyacid dehydrogenase [Variovorax atrisoli]|uniref:hydroxyacid dehydrogenase n=1 Tax=Variovorax atrisoli TaxID=3394203 RepID=UPI000F7E8780|nr:hydroxyacid dehydrogenase [Variovorax sp. 369]RTD85309.1 hydroxyacid dehydrogenase [Variovorax sp. 369]